MSRYLKQALAVACLLPAQLAWADFQGRLNVLASAAAAAPGLHVTRLALGPFVDRDSGQPSQLSRRIEDGLRQALAGSKAWTLLDSGEDGAGADGVMAGSFGREGDGIRLRAELKAGPEGKLFWSRNALIPASELEAGDLEPSSQGAEPEPVERLAGDASPGPYESQVIPTFRARPRREHHFHMDLSTAYKAFFPTNSSFQSQAGARMDGVSLGLSFNDIVLLDFDFWRQDISGLGTVQSLDYAGANLALVYPLRLGSAVTLYAGPELRLASIAVNDSELDSDSDPAVFGNSGFDALGGIKLKMGRVGLDARYSYDLAASHTGYHTMRLGVFYEFGN